MLLYTIPLKNNKNLRDVKGFKIFLVVIGWLSLVVGVPISMPQKFDIDLFIRKKNCNSKLYKISNTKTKIHNNHRK